MSAGFLTLACKRSCRVGSPILREQFACSQFYESHRTRRVSVTVPANDVAKYGIFMRVLGLFPFVTLRDVRVAY